MKRLRAMGFVAVLVGLILAANAPCVHAEEQLDLNRATLEEIRALPISEEVAETIWRYREYTSYYGSVYELRTLPGVTIEDFQRIKPLVKISAVAIEDEELQRINEIYYRIRQWESEEGGGEALVDHWIDLAKDPVNVNTATYNEIANLQSVSPPDAAAIFKYMRKNRVERRSQLRNIPGLTYWGYYNVRNFVRYDDPAEDAQFRGSYQFRVYDTPSIFDTEELLKEDRNFADGGYDSWWDRLDLDSAGPIYQHKFRGRWGQDINAGALAYKGFGDEEFTAFKFHTTIKDKSLGPVTFDNIVLGNYALAFGQGLVMQNTDYFKPRNSGYGWDKRYMGILGDISPTQEFQLNGIATEMTYGNVKSVVFYSDDWKDAVLNPDGTINQYIIMSPRISNDDLAAAGMRDMRDVVHEQTLGANVKYGFAPGSWIGVSAYESRYNKYWKSGYDPNGTMDVAWIVPDDNEDKLVAADGEYFSSYTSPGKFRRVFGTEFQYVVDNVAFAGEYAALDKDGELFDFEDDAHAFVVNAYASYSNLSFLALYRDYDVDFDNPYSRAFSEYKRYKGTILEDQYYLSDPIYGLLYVNSVTPQAERGLYVNSRYRFSDRLTPSIEYDVWERKADGADYSRLVLKLRFQPIYNIVMNLRQKWQGRLGENWMTPQTYEQVETRFRLEYRLSKYDEVEFMLSRAWIEWPPRPRLSGNPEADGEYPDVGSAAVPSYAVGAAVTHNFSDWLKVTGSVLYYDGFIWLFEDGSFTIIDDHAFRYWISISDRISDHLSLRFRWTNNQAFPLTYVDTREYGENPPGDPEPNGWYVRDDNAGFRLQLDYSW